MRFGKLASSLLAVAALTAAGHAMAASAGDVITGTLAFGPDGGYGGDYWDQSSIVDPGTFTYADYANSDSASFSGNVLTINDDVLINANGWEMTFTDTTTPFTSLTLVSDNFTPGLTYSFSNGTAVIDWLGTSDTLGPLQATFNVAGGVPEPATWATMILGMFGIGAVLRSRRKLAGATAVA